MLTQFSVTETNRPPIAKDPRTSTAAESLTILILATLYVCCSAISERSARRP